MKYTITRMINHVFLFAQADMSVKPTSLMLHQHLKTCQGNIGLLRGPLKITLILVPNQIFLGSDVISLSSYFVICKVC